MRKLRLTVALAAALGGCAFASSTALANEFVLKQLKETPLEAAIKGGNGTAGAYGFDFGPFAVTCDQAKSTGTVTKTALTESLKFKGCVARVLLSDEPVTLAVTAKEPLALSYDADGLTTLTAPFALTVKALKCTIEVPAQEELENESTIENQQLPTTRFKYFPSGLHETLSISDDITGLGYSFAGASCSSLGNPADGTFTDTTFDEALNTDVHLLKTIGGGWNEVKNHEVT